jgi:hypothetical protein
MSQVVTPVEKRLTDVPAVSDPAAGESAIGAVKVVIEGDPRVDEKAFDRLVDALWSAYYDWGHEKVVHVTFYLEDGGWVCFTVTAPFGSKGLDYAVFLDEDGRPLYVADFSAVTISEATEALLSFVGKDAGTIAKVEVEVGERW